MNSDEITVNFVKDAASVIREQQLGEATTQISYISQGFCLVIGEPGFAIASAAPLASTGFAVVSIDNTATTTTKQLTDEGVAVFTVPALNLEGYLGAYSATAPQDTSNEDVNQFNLAVSVYRETGCFDLVLDLSEQPLIPTKVPPFGYFHANTEEKLDTAIDQIKELVGEFEKPRYFEYRADICAHSRSELAGCSRCLDVCTTGAISTHGEGVEVDPFLCQGCGSCATVCPSGAMTYAYPRPKDAIKKTRENIKQHASDTLLLFAEANQSRIDALKLPDSVLTLMVEEVTAFGADYWLSVLAGHVSSIIVVLESTDASDANYMALRSQLDWLDPLFKDLNIHRLPVTVYTIDELEEQSASDAIFSTTQFADNPTVNSLGLLSPAEYLTHGDKRQTIRLALDALCEQINPSSTSVELPAQAPFGRIYVDQKACTLCMACVSTCPAKALLDGQDSPALRFVEANCLQCGLCEQACPEDAISLQAQYTWDSLEARKIQTLHEEQPFHCIRCHTPFTTQAMVDTMTEKLSGHWMFQDDKAIRRLRLCGDCRVKDMFEEDASGIEVHR